jgi:hypothetical protein
MVPSATATRGSDVLSRHLESPARVDIHTLRPSLHDDGVDWQAVFGYGEPYAHQTDAVQQARATLVDGGVCVLRAPSMLCEGSVTDPHVGGTGFRADRPLGRHAAVGTGRCETVR